MLFGRSIFGIALLFLWLYAIVDVISTDRALCRNLPKIWWLVIVIVLGPMGAAIWLGAGRPRRAGVRPGDTTVRARPMRAQPRPLRDAPAVEPPAPPTQDWAQERQRLLDEYERRKRGEDSPPDETQPPAPAPA